MYARRICRLMSQFFHCSEESKNIAEYWPYFLFMVYFVQYCLILILLYMYFAPKTRHDVWWNHSRKGNALTPLRLCITDSTDKKWFHLSNLRYNVFAARFELKKRLLNPNLITTVNMISDQVFLDSTFLTNNVNRIDKGSEKEKTELTKHL